MASTRNLEDQPVPATQSDEGPLGKYARADGSLREEYTGPRRTAGNDPSSMLPDADEVYLATAATTAEDLALLLDVMAGFDERDSTCIDRPKDDYVGALGAVRGREDDHHVRLMAIGDEYLGAVEYISIAFADGGVRQVEATRVAATAGAPAAANAQPPERPRGGRGFGSGGVHLLAAEI